MSSPFMFGRDPRVDEILAQIKQEKISRDYARNLLFQIGLEQFDEDYEYGNASESEARQTKQA